MSKFFVVFAVQNSADDFEVHGIFTREDDALAFIEQKKQSGDFICIPERPQHLEMDAIIGLLVEDRLKELADPIKKLAAKFG